MLRPLVKKLRLMRRDATLRKLAAIAEQHGKTYPDFIGSLFDKEYYLSHSPDVVAAGVDPLDHYMTSGWIERRNPSKDFQSEYYRATYDDVRQSGLPPLFHYALIGRAERRKTVGEGHYESVQAALCVAMGLDQIQSDKVIEAFDPGYYESQLSPEEEHPSDLLLHYLNEGWKRGIDPSKKFDTDFYCNHSPDIIEGGMNPFVHWVAFGQEEGRPAVGQYEPGKQLLPLEETDWSACPQDQLNDIAEDFDSEFYLASYPEVAELGIDPRAHYLMHGWLKDYDPRPDFSTSDYRARYHDIRKSLMNPFVHYVRHGKEAGWITQSEITKKRKTYRPLVSVIVPNYNHAEFLEHRLKSIADQSYDNTEIIILDDASNDNSQEVIRTLVDKLEIDAKLVFNDRNSGNVFAQWRRGMELAQGDLVWICESDDFCETDFLDKLVPAFADDSVNIAFGQIQFSDRDGQLQKGMDGFREGAEAGIWDKTLTRPAAEWLNGAWGVNNVIANVGGCLLRNMTLPDAIWDEARSYRICGDWFLYIKIAGAGQVCYEPEAVSYFRQHGQNTSASNFREKYYYDELFRILTLIAETWGNHRHTREKFIRKVRSQFDGLELTSTIGDFDQVFSPEQYLEVQRKHRHVQLHFLGFQPGGGELFPINLANAMCDAGIVVSMLAANMGSVNDDMRSRLNARIPVYQQFQLGSKGRKGFIDACGISVINTHVANSDANLAGQGHNPMECAYVPSLHGSYVVFDNPDAENPEWIQQTVGWIIENVDRWIYTADRNLEFFEGREVDRSRFVKLPNAMPRDPRPAPFTRADLGIKDTDTVYTFVARGILHKGWLASVSAMRDLQEIHNRFDIHLLLIGEGDATEQAKDAGKDVQNLHFLGYRSEINGILRMSDALLLPSRFPGESFPLCLIQAIQEHVPGIVTDIGETRAMMTGNDGEACGILLENQSDNFTFGSSLVGAMLRMSRADQRDIFASRAEKRAEAFDLDRLVNRYMEEFDLAQAAFEAKG